MKKDYSRRSLSSREKLSHLFTITSPTGAGGSSLTEMLGECFMSQKIKMDIISGGRIMRGFAKKMGLSIEAFSEYNRKHPEEGWDWKCDRKIQELGNYNFQIIEGRLPHAFVPKGFHIYLDCPIQVRAERRHKYQNPEKLSLSEITKMISQRDDNDLSRYQVRYLGCIWPPKDFDLVIDSSKMTIEQEVQAIIRGWKKRACDNQKLIHQTC